MTTVANSAPVCPLSGERQCEIEIPGMLLDVFGRIESCSEGIASYCHPEKTVGLVLVERVNNKNQRTTVSAHGYRDRKYSKLEVIAESLPPLPGNAIPTSGIP